MLRVFIPDIGEIITLAEDWTFQVVNERRNQGLAICMGKEKSDDYYYPFGTEESQDVSDIYGRFGRRRVPKDAGTFTWKAGTSLEVDRIYIRKGNEDFSSVTFKARVKGKVVRFFAKLADVNRIEV